MTNEKSRIADAIRGAGYAQSARLESVTEPLLARLPKRKARTKQDKLLMATAMAAALLVFFAFGMPKVVQAAEQLYRFLFSQRAEQIEQYQALPEEDKLAQMTAQYESMYRTHAVDASTEFDGVTVTVTKFYIVLNDENDPSKGNATLDLSFSRLPSFDPNYMDFALRCGDRNYPMVMHLAQKEYRKAGLHEMTEEKWNVNDEGYLASTSLREDGVPMCSTFIPMDSWTINERTDMVLVGTIDGKTLEIPFTYDPALAHAFATEEAKSGVEYEIASSAKELSHLERAAINAGQVGLTVEDYEIQYAISELALYEDQLYTTLVFPNLAYDDLRDKLPTYMMEIMWVDGQSVDMKQVMQEKLAGNALMRIYHGYLQPGQALPEESLIVVRLNNGGDDDPLNSSVQYVERNSYSVFRYNWNEAKATLPQDEAERSAWLAQAKQQIDARNAAPLPLRSFYMGDSGKEQKLGSMVVQVPSIWVEGSLVSIFNPFNLNPFDFDGSMYEGATMNLWTEAQREPTLEIDGVKLEFERVTMQHDLPSRIYFRLPDGAEVAAKSRIALSVPGQLVKDGEVLDEQVYKVKSTLTKGGAIGVTQPTIELPD